MRRYQAWLMLLLTALAAPTIVQAEAWIELTPENITLDPMVVDAFLTSIYKGGYPANPLARTDAFVGHANNSTYILVHHDALCDAEGCPLLRYLRLKEGALPFTEQKVTYRLLGRMALVHIEGMAQILYAEPERSDFRTTSGLPLISVLEARFGPVLHDTQKIDLANVFVGSADLDGDGIAEILIRVRDPDRDCSGFNPGCSAVILQRDDDAKPSPNVLQISDERWISIGNLGGQFLPCRAGGSCVAVMLLDEEVDGYRTLLVGNGKRVWNPSLGRYEWVDLEGFPWE